MRETLVRFLIFANSSGYIIVPTMEDADEFLRGLLDKIHDEIDAAVLPKPDLENVDPNGALASSPGAAKPDPPASLPVDDNFACEMEHEVVCTGCQKSSVNREVYRGFSLNLPDPSMPQSR